MIEDGISVIIPAFDEEEAIGDILDEVRSALQAASLKAEIIVVDDGSQDSTARIAGEQGAVLVRHPVNRGYGASLKSGIALSRHEAILFMDGDGTYIPGDLVSLVEKAAGYEMVVGAREGKEATKPFFRRTVKRILRALANYLTGSRIPDLNSGMRLVKKDVLLRYMDLLPSGFSFTSTITVALLTNNHAVCYVPIGYRKRKGRSKIRPVKDTLKAFQAVLRTAFYFNPLKVFLLLSLMFFAPGAVWAVYQSIAFGNFPVGSVVFILIGIQFLVIGLLARPKAARSNPD